MKKITILAAVVALLGSCAQNTEDTINPNNKTEGRTIYATFDNEEEETKTYVENYKYLRWHAGDEISFFDATTHNSQYAFAGNNGDAEGEFNAVATGEGTAIATTYGVYPYNAKTSISEEGVLSVELPATQAYGVNSFGKGANTMVAVGESATDDKLFFKNACGYLVVKLYNENGATVKSVVLKGNNEEKIAGTATITATHAGVPSVVMADTATASVTVDCGAGVLIGTTAETATEFWFALPEITFEGGITITATDTEGKEYEKTTTKPVAITRNNVQPMKALGAEFKATKPANNEIWYTATKMITPYEYAQNAFNVPWIESVFLVETGEGVITFDGDLTKIGDEAFMFCDKLNTITIPDSVTSIGSSAFNGCSSLESITIPDGVTSIGSRAFSGCYSLTNIIIPDGVTSIGYSVFNYCKSLASITIPEGVTSIGNSAFNGCSSLASITIPEGVTSIGYSVFDGCSGIASIIIPDSVTSIGDRAFNNCTSLASITIPDGVTSIGEQAFNGCSSLASITIPEGVTSIGNSAFSGCKSLTSITIPDGVTSIGSSAFKNCTSLAEFKGKFASKDGRCVVVDGVLRFFAPAGLDEYAIPDSVTSIGDSAFYGTNISHIEIPDAVQSIGKWAFQNCTKLSNVNLGKGVILLDNKAFEGCISLREVTIPNSLKQIGLYVFYKCSNLSSVYCCPQTPPSPNGTASELKYWWCFNDTASDLQIFVPISSESKYKSQIGWRDYADKIVGYDFTE